MSPFQAALAVFAALVSVSYSARGMQSIAALWAVTAAVNVALGIWIASL